MAQGSSTPVTFAAAPLFPLPNVVLFPRAVLPLHVFEERYKAMTADVLKGDRRIAMALLRAGWEKDYYARPAIEPVVCVGEIVSHERLADGTYNFLLQGIARARVLREVGDGPYRIAELEPVPETAEVDLELLDQRERLTRMLQADVAAFLPGATQFLQMLSSPLPTAAIADLVAFHLLDDVELKQSLLGEGNVRKRVTRTVDALRAMQPVEAVANPRFPKDPSWN